MKSRRQTPTRGPVPWQPRCYPQPWQAQRSTSELPVKTTLARERRLQVSAPYLAASRPALACPRTGVEPVRRHFHIENRTPISEPSLGAQRRLAFTGHQYSN